jgi:hypothetical protein
VIFEAQQGRELLLIQLFDADTNVVCEHEVQKALLLAVEVAADGDLKFNAF